MSAAASTDVNPNLALQFVTSSVAKLQAHIATMSSSEDAKVVGYAMVESYKLERSRLKALANL